MSSGQSRFSVLALSVVLQACSDPTPAGNEGFVDASGDCAGCAHVVRGLQFVREVALLGEILYIADTDGQQLLRVDLERDRAGRIGTRGTLGSRSPCRTRQTTLRPGI
jgi:hypothetical protein